MINVEALATMVDMNTTAMKELMAKTNAIYITLLETDLGPKMVENYEMLKKHIAAAEGDSVMHSVLGSKPGD